MSLIYCGLGAFFVTQYIRELTPHGMHSAVGNLAVAVLSSVLLSYGLHRHFETVVLGLAGAGLAVLVHRFGRLLRALGDRAIREVIASGLRR